MKNSCILVLLSLFIVISCGGKESEIENNKSPTGSENVIIELKGFGLTDEDIMAYIRSLPEESRRTALGSKENLKLVIQDIIRLKILYREAISKGLDRDPVYLKKLEEVKENLLVARLLEEEIDKKINPTEEEIIEYYNSNIDLYTAPEEVRISHIVVQTEKEALHVIERLKKGESFEELARKYSLDTDSAKRGGDLGFFFKDQLPKPLQESIFSLKIGEFTVKPVKTLWGFQIIRVTDYRPEKVLPLSEVRNQIIEDIKGTKRKEFFKEYMETLEKKYNVKVNWNQAEKLLYGPKIDYKID